MRPAFIIGGFLALFFASQAAATDFSGPKNEPTPLIEPSGEMPLGERLFYDVSWMGVPVGTGEIWVKEKSVFAGRDCFHVIATARTNDFLSKIYPVHDEVHSWIDARTLQSLGFAKKVSEGLYRANESVRYDVSAKKGHYRSIQNGSEKVFDIRVPVHDALSAFYWARRQFLWPGTTAKTTVNNGEKDYDLRFEAIRRETKEIPGEEADTILVEPKSLYKGILDKRGRVWVNLKNDAARTPVMVSFRTPFGPIVGIKKMTTEANRARS